jgi:hypothetical protein
MAGEVMRRLRRVLLVVFVITAAAVATDRIALWVWRAPVWLYGDALERAAAELASGVVHHSSRPLIVCSDGDGPSQTPLLQVALRGPRPDEVTVSGNHAGITLLYIPPMLAWSRHVPWAYRREIIQSSDLYPYNDVYVIRVYIGEIRPKGRAREVPRVEFDHGLPF